MMRPDHPVRVVMYDPGAFIPYYVDQLCRAMAASGCAPEVIASRPLFAPVATGGHYRVAPLFFTTIEGAALGIVRHRRRLRWLLKGLSYPGGAWRTWRALRAGPPGILHVQWAPVPTIDAMLVRALRRAGWRIVYTVHDPLISASRILMAHGQARLLSSSDAVIVHTQQQAAEIAGRLPGIGSRIRVIRHGAVTHPLPDESERTACRAAIGVDSARPMLLVFGQLKPYKGLETIIDAMPAVISRIPDVVLVIAGEPFIPVRRIEQRINTRGVSANVLFRPGFVADALVPLYLRGADLLVAPYNRAGASGVVVLAQSHGLPVLVSRVGGLPEFVEPGRSGWVVPPRSADALAESICQALGGRQELREAGRQGWLRLVREHQWSDVAARTLSVYDDIRAVPQRDLQLATAEVT
jgi:glycosyltransferase involved in cell wall biosynthesis